MFAEDDGGRVVQEAAEGAAAERVIVARVQDEFVPKIIGDLRRHRDVALAAHQIGEKKLPESAREQRAVLARKAGVMLFQPLEQPARPAEGTDEFGPPQRTPLAIEPGTGEQGDAQQDGKRYGHDAVDTSGSQSASGLTTGSRRRGIQRQREQRDRAEHEAEHETSRMPRRRGFF